MFWLKSDAVTSNSLMCFCARISYLTLYNVILGCTVNKTYKYCIISITLSHIKQYTVFSRFMNI